MLSCMDAGRAREAKEAEAIETVYEQALEWCGKESELWCFPAADCDVLFYKTLVSAPCANLACSCHAHMHNPPHSLSHRSASTTRTVCAHTAPHAHAPHAPHIMHCTCTCSHMACTHLRSHTALLATCSHRAFYWHLLQTCPRKANVRPWNKACLCV